MNRNNNNKNFESGLVASSMKGEWGFEDLWKHKSLMISTLLSNILLNHLTYTSVTQQDRERNLKR